MEPEIKVIVTYKGERLTLRKYTETPEIQPLYPSKEDFINKIYAPLLNKARETNTNQVLQITEHVITINGEIFEMS